MTWGPVMPAGEYLDRLIAIHVYGRTFCEHSKVRSVAQSGGWAMCADRTCKGEMHWKHVPSYSTDLYYAWQLVEHLKKTCELDFRCWSVVDHEAGLDGTEFIFEHGKNDVRGQAMTSTLPHSIALAALRAVGYHA